MDASVNGADAVIKRLLNLPKKVRYAAAKAVNDTAKEVQTFTVQSLLPDKFTLRARGAPWWKPGNPLGFNIKFANKDTLTGEVGSRANWLKLHEEGGTKTARSGGRIAIVEGARPSPTSVIPRARKPRQMMDSGKAFMVPTKAGPGIYERAGKKLHLLYLIKPSAQINPELDYVESGKKIADNTIGTRFNIRFAEEMAR